MYSSKEKFLLLFTHRHRLTRHQYYLQFRKDIMEDRLYCNEETGLFLAALALQAEFGDYMPEVPRTKKEKKNIHLMSINTSIIFQRVLQQHIWLFFMLF